MKLTFYGADKEVTGSCHCLTVSGKQILVDCGLAQGVEEKEDNRLPFSVAQIEAVCVTHAHIDHSGRLPLLVKSGYTGPIFATGKTCELLRIMLLDSAHIQESDAKWKSQKNKRAAKPSEQPLYTAKDALDAIRLLRPVNYEETVEICEGVSARFTDAGHLLGSASITVDAMEEGVSRRIVFSGDIGNYNHPIICDPVYLTDADYVVMESTYGNRIHHKAGDLAFELANIFDETFARGGDVIIPTFAVGRAQELLYHIREMKEQNLVKSVPMFPVYLDSPLAEEATKVYDGDLHGYADEETVELIKNGFDPISFDHLTLCKSLEESIALNTNPNPKVILSASGMCDAGRIRHHLKHHLWRPESSVVLVGYQAKGTLGRILLERPAHVKLFGEEVAVRAQIYNFKGMSSHADRDGLLRWADAFSRKPKQVFVVHGEEAAAESLTRELILRGQNAMAPDYEMSFDLIGNQVISPGVAAARLRTGKRTGGDASSVYSRLELTGQRLQNVIRNSQGMPNKDLAKFERQLRELIAQWSM